MYLFMGGIARACFMLLYRDDKKDKRGFYTEGVRGRRARYTFALYPAMGPLFDRCACYYNQFHTDALRYDKTVS